MEQFEAILISALNQYTYCPRRCYLIHNEGEFTDNIHTISGTMEHEKVDQVKHEVKQGVRVEFALPVWSDRLGLTGRCDAVEFHPDGSIYPVEYKHGKRNKWLNDDLQLAAQAVCLEEMMKVTISTGAIYHQQSRRRREVDINQHLREELEQTIQLVKTTLSKEHCPPPIHDTKRCPQCSLISLCNPELINSDSLLKKLSKQLFTVEEENME